MCREIYCGIGWGVVRIGNEWNRAMQWRIRVAFEKERLKG